MGRCSKLIVCLGAGMLAAGCPKGKTDYTQGRRAEHLQDYDAAYDYYQKALKNDPEKAEWVMKWKQGGCEASSVHGKNGVKLRERGQLEGVASEFQRAADIDPSSPIAEQELRKTVSMIEEKNRANNAATEPPKSESGELPLATTLPELKVLSRAPISLHMTNDAKIVFETIAKLAGITVIFDPDFPARRIPAELDNVTLQQALDIASLEAKAVWKPVTENIIFVFPDQPAKRRDYEESVVQTFNLSNTVQAQDLTEIDGAAAIAGFEADSAAERAECHHHSGFAGQAAGCGQGHPGHRQGQAGSGGASPSGGGARRQNAQPGNFSGDFGQHRGGAAGYDDDHGHNRNYE